ncbi:sterol desaturase family protein [Aeromicrobium sp.]|uniref:sterol desaturase family protein n=1 Tax=Aeromicrobium sp. TaxID=1871063 RepID=UPI003C3B0AE7
MSELLDPLQNPTLVAAPFFILSLLIEIAAFRYLETDDQMRGYERKDARTSLWMGVGSIVSSAVLKFGTLIAFVAVSVHLAPWHLPTDTWWSWTLLILGLDLAFYLQHRFVHRVRIGWAAHQAHHSSEYFNLSTALRQKWNPWAEALFWLPFPLLGFAPWTLYVAFSFNLIFQFFVHTERIDTMWRPIELIFNTPSHHRVHHGSDPEYLDKNYAGMFIVWDRMFGTFQKELFRPTYGLTVPVDTYNLLRLQYGAFGELFRDVHQAKNWRHKLGYVFMPPGWHPGETRVEAERPRQAVAQN